MRKAVILPMVLAPLLLAAASPAFAVHLRVPFVAPYRAGQSQGNIAAVRGLADIHEDASFQGTDVNLIGPTGRVEFIGFIPKLNEYAFPGIAALNGKQVAMYGIIELYWGLPATQLTSPDQLRPAPPPAG